MSAMIHASKRKGPYHRCRAAIIVLNAIISLAAVANTLTVELAGSTLEPLSAILTESVAKGVHRLQLAHTPSNLY